MTACGPVRQSIWIVNDVQQEAAMKYNALLLTGHYDEIILHFRQ
jgi:hypothetical protein